MNQSTTQKKGRENMQTKFGRMLSIMVCVAAALILAAPAWADGEVFVAGANIKGDAAYMVSYGDGSFSSLQMLQTTQGSGITSYPLTYGNGIGDFNNDSHYDYIVGLGYGGGEVYISAGNGTGFAAPVPVAVWGGGYYAMDMAVADFNGDGNQDFVMSYLFSTTTGLYLGDGNFGFTYSALTDSAASYSAGIDAADFNGDELVDFVVASNSYDPIYVNLNNGDGTFTKVTLATHDGNMVYGIAAADFNNDRNADIMTAGYDYLILYTGNGDGTFQWAATYEFDLNQTAIDNYDFNGDHIQDLVASNYGTDVNGIAVLLNNGDGTFYLDSIYPGPVGELYAVAAPPYVPASNMDPVAVLDPGILEVTAGEAVELDGSQSYDEDGEIVSYAWTFGDEMAVDGADAVQTHTYDEPATYIVTLTVTDDQGATASVQAEVHVAPVPAVPVSVAFNPYLLNLHSRDKWITAIIRVPDGYDARQIDTATIQIVPEDGEAITAYSGRSWGFFHKLFRRYHSRRTLTVRFAQQAVGNALAGTSGHTLLKVVGKMNNNGKSVDFSGEGAIHVLGKHNKLAHHGRKHGRR
jgi:PKD repeat protein